MPKENLPTDPPASLGKTLHDYAIDTRIAELKRTITLLEARIAELQRIKATPAALGELPSIE